VQSTTDNELPEDQSRVVERYLAQRVVPSLPIRLASRGAVWLIVKAPGLWPLLRRPAHRAWNRIGSEWDQNIKPDSADHTAPLAAACDRIEPEPRTILELGTGSGAGARMLAKRFPEADVTGIDLAETMIAAARANTPPELTDRLSFKVGDAASLTYLKDMFDLVVHLNIPPFVGVVARVLRPGGYVIVADSFGPGTPSHVRVRTLRRSFARHGLDVVARGQAQAGTFLIARRALSPE
jgi:SAM-dependent methyltransferase